MFKHLAVTAVLLIAMTGSAVANDSPCEDQDGSGKTMCVSVLLSLGPTGSTVLSSGVPGDDREAYLGQVRDDAAEYVGLQGAAAPSAFLKDAIAQIREKSAAATSMTDLEIAKILVSSGN